MAKKIKCAECGKSVSEIASRCPHCKTRNIRKKACVVCRKKEKASALVNLSERGVLGQSGNYYMSRLPTNHSLPPMSGFAHNTCLNDIHPIYRHQASSTRVTKACATCEKELFRPLISLMEKGDYQEPMSCSGCGEDVYINLYDSSHRPCAHCGVLLDINDRRVVSGSNGALPKDQDDFYHVYCTTQVRERRSNSPLLTFIVLGAHAFLFVQFL